MRGLTVTRLLVHRQESEASALTSLAFRYLLYPGYHLELVGLNPRHPSVKPKARQSALPSDRFVLVEAPLFLISGSGRSLSKSKREAIGVQPDLKPHGDEPHRPILVASRLWLLAHTARLN